MKHLTKTLLIAAASCALSGPAFAATALFQPSGEKADPIIIINNSDIADAQRVFEKPLKLNVSTLSIATDPKGFSSDEAVYSDDIDLDYHLTEQAFIGIADIHEDAPITGEKGGFPEGRHIDPYRSVAGGGIKTKF